MKQSAAVKEAKAALEALFQKKPEAAERIEKMIPTVTPFRGGSRRRPTTPEGARRVQAPGPAPQDQQRAQNPGRRSPTRSTPSSAPASVMPEDRELYLQMLEHRDEERA